MIGMQVPAPVLLTSFSQSPGNLSTIPDRRRSVRMSGGFASLYARGRCACRAAQSSCISHPKGNSLAGIKLDKSTRIWELVLLRGNHA